jgi:hypothetical protein
MAASCRQQHHGVLWFGAPYQNYGAGQLAGCGYSAPTTLNGQVTSELAHLWSVTLGNIPFYGTNPDSQKIETTTYYPRGLQQTHTKYVGLPGWGMLNQGDMNFSPSSYYDSPTSFWMNGPEGLKVFNVAVGFQGSQRSWSPICDPNGRYCENPYQWANVLAVHDGDLMPVPEPAVVVLMFAGLAVVAPYAHARRMRRGV